MDQAVQLDGISIRQAGKAFLARDGSRIEALVDVSIEIARGEFIAIVGPSGCGKSTLMRLIAGLMPLSSGVIEVGGASIGGPVVDVGVVFQKPVLLEWRTVLDNILLQVELRGGDKATARTRAMELISAVGLDGFEHAYPRQLSGGMQQRASIARALIHDPPLLLMDEPLGALDALTREQMRIDLEELWLQSGTTVVFITHSIDEALLLADRVVVMSPRPGRIEHVIEVDMPRPRGIDGRKNPRFGAGEAEITRIFLERGVLRRTSALARSSRAGASG